MTSKLRIPISAFEMSLETSTAYYIRIVHILTFTALKVRRFMYTVEIINFSGSTSDYSFQPSTILSADSDSYLFLKLDSNVRMIITFAQLRHPPNFGGNLLTYSSM